jgi:PBP1b-binding outer membrane lipoprotein LpoB
MNVGQRVALLLAGLALVVLSGCTQPSAPAASTQPAASQTVPATDSGPGASTQPSGKGRGDY